RRKARARVMSPAGAAATLRSASTSARGVRDGRRDPRHGGAGHRRQRRHRALGPSDRKRGLTTSVDDTATTSTVKGGALAGLGLAVVLGAQVVVVLDFSIVNVALPDISS